MFVVTYSLIALGLAFVFAACFVAAAIVMRDKMRIYIDGKHLPRSYRHTSVIIELDNGDQFALFPGKDEIHVKARGGKALFVRPVGGANSIRLKAEKL